MDPDIAFIMSILSIYHANALGRSRQSVFQPRANGNLVSFLEFLLSTCAWISRESPPKPTWNIVVFHIVLSQYSKISVKLRGIFNLC